MLKKIDMPWLIVGTLALLFGISVSLVEVTATEAWIQGQTFLTYRPSLEIIAQPFQLITNTLPMGNVLSVTVGWGIELAFIIFALGYEVTTRSVRHRSPKAAGWWELGMGACVLTDFVTNVIYAGTVAPQLGGFGSFLLRVFISALICGFAMLFPVAGWALIVESFGGSAGSSARPAVPAQMVPHKTN